MKFYDAGIMFLVAIFVSAISIATFNYCYDKIWDDDNPAEEYIEKIIEKQFYFEDGTIDLSPSSPETY